MDAHEINEVARVLSHRHYAAVVDADPSLLETARKLISSNIAEHGGTMGQHLWDVILRRPWNDVRERMLKEDPDGQLLRSSSPFSVLIGVRDPRERSRMWQLAKQELSDRKIFAERSAA